MSRLKLPRIGIRLPAAWDDPAEREWAQLRAEAEDLNRDVLVGGAVMDAVERLRALLRRGARAEVLATIGSRTDAGALAWLWCETEGDCRDTISATFLDAIQEHHARPTRLMVDRLELVYFERFDRIDQLGEGIRSSLARVLERGWTVTGRYDAERAGILAADDAPRLVARSIREAGLSMTDGLRDWGLDLHEGGRFVELVRQYLFLERLRQIPVGEDDPALDELRAPVVFEAPHVRGQMVGHAALGILIERSETYPGDLWRDLVLDIAGDPRLTYAEHYQQWWPVLGADAEERVISWLAIADLSMFLELLTEFAESDPSMKRMLSARRRMLEGLVNEGVVRRSRLFLGEDVRLFVQRIGTANRRWDSALLRGNQQREKALLYLDCGDFHLVEGSHNTKLWVYLTRPGERLVAPRERSFLYKELTSDLAASYEDRRRRELGDDYDGLAHKGIAHQGMWQRPFLEFLGEHRIYVNPEAILEPGVYRKLRQTSGLVLARRD